MESSVRAFRPSQSNQDLETPTRVMAAKPPQASKFAAWTFASLPRRASSEKRTNPQDKAALTSRLKTLASEHYGTAGPAFVAQVVAAKEAVGKTIFKLREGFQADPCVQVLLDSNPVMVKCSACWTKYPCSPPPKGWLASEGASVLGGTSSQCRPDRSGALDHRTRRHCRTRGPGS